MEQVAHLGARQAVHPGPPDLRNGDEALARDLEMVGVLNVTRQNQYEMVARIQAVVPI